MIGGAIVGGLLGSNIGGGNALASTAGSAGGAVVGGLAGNAAENSIGTSKATLYIVQINGGNLVSVIQQSPVPLCVGDHIYRH